MEFSKDTFFVITGDGIPVTINAEGYPMTCAWDKKEPREYDLDGVEFYPSTLEKFQEARKDFQADS